MTIQKAEIQFNVDGKKVSFIIYHNLPEQFGLNLECALDCWLARTRKYTAKSLCEYIKSKDNNIIAVTEKEFNKIINQ